MVALFIVVFFYFFGPASWPKITPSHECVMNLKQIDGAKDEWASQYHKTTNDTPLDADLFGTNAFFNSKPVCPEGGVYRLGRVGQKATCNVPGHVLR